MRCRKGKGTGYCISLDLKSKEVDEMNLINKFLAKEISDEEIITLKSWLSADPGNRKIFDEENELWQESGLKANLRHFKTDAAWLNISSKLGFGRRTSGSVVHLSRNNYRLLLVAASLVLLLTAGAIYLWTTGRMSLRQARLASTTILTKEKEKSHIYLSDSTEVYLNSGSTLQYYGLYNVENRIVKLTGEGFFNVHTNPKKPFIVQMDQLSVTATGTRFNVFSYHDADRIETTLEEGTINVSIKGKQPVKVKSGQQVIYFRESGKVLLREVETDTYTSWKENKLRFIDTPFQEVMRKIARAYKVKIEITNRDLLNLKYTATFIDESIEQVMEMLKTVSPIIYKIKYRTSVDDKKYTEPEIIIGMRKTRKLKSN